ncbi:MAG: hypothetical protein WC675_00200 [Patescibacteria group bacterium]|jgi:hypothetical protein
MARPTPDQVAFLQSHGLEPPRSVWNCKPNKWLCQHLIAYFKQGNGATQKGAAETLEDRVELYEAALLEFLHLIVVPIVLKPRGILVDETNGPLEVLGIDPKSPGYVARQKQEAKEGDPAISPFHVTIVPANTLIKEGNVYGGDLEDYCVAPQGIMTEGHSFYRFGQGRVHIPGEPAEPVNFFRLLEFDAGLL